MSNLFTLFIDPILRGPTIGSMLIGISAGVMGVVAFVQKRSLVGETLSHASYPGVALALVAVGFFSLDHLLPFFIACGAFATAFLGILLCGFLQKKMGVKNDSALCFVLALFFGLGILLVSVIQYTYPKLYRQTQQYLYGQAATMTDIHLLIYAVLTILILSFVVFFFKEIQTLSFDRHYAESKNPLASRVVNMSIFFLTILSVVIGIRSVGVILMAAMMIIPAVTARQFTNHLNKMFFIAALVGMLSGYIGTYISFIFSKSHFSLPTGPMVVLAASFFAFYALLFSSKKGLVVRFFRIARFRSLTLRENLLKTIWRLDQKNGILFSGLKGSHGFSGWYLKMILFRLQLEGWVTKKEERYFLTPGGFKKGGQIIRLHRLWEVYLVNSLGLNVERVHKSAEEMEHILTPELEKKLTELLDNPQQDPHAQPIPPQKEVMSHGL